MKKLMNYITLHFSFQFLPSEPLLGIYTERGRVEFEPDVPTPYWQIQVGCIFWKIIYSNVEGFN